MNIVHQKRNFIRKIKKPKIIHNELSDNKTTQDNNNNVPSRDKQKALIVKTPLDPTLKPQRIPLDNPGQSSVAYSLLDVNCCPPVKIRYIAKNQYLVDDGLIPYLNQHGKTLFAEFQSKIKTGDYVTIKKAALETTQSGPQLMPLFEDDDLWVPLSLINKYAVGYVDVCTTTQYINTLPIIFTDGNFVYTSDKKVFKLELLPKPECVKREAEDEVIASSEEEDAATKDKRELRRIRKLKRANNVVHV
jgi:hypothetical protein